MANEMGSQYPSHYLVFTGNVCALRSILCTTGNFYHNLHDVWKSKNPQLLRLHYRFPNCSPLEYILDQINAVNDLHSIFTIPINRNIPTGKVCAGFLTKTSYVLLAFFVHLVLLSTIQIISGKSCTSWSSTRCRLHRTSVTSYLLGPHNLTFVFSNYRKLRLSVFVRDQRLTFNNEHLKLL